MKTKNSGLIFRLLPLVAALAAISAFAQGTNRYEGSTWALVDAKKTMAAASDITLAKYPDCDDATVEKKMVRVYRADGTGESQDETFVKVLTEKGKRNNRTISLEFHAAVFHGGGGQGGGAASRTATVVPVDVAANSKETD